MSHKSHPGILTDKVRETPNNKRMGMRDALMTVVIPTYNSADLILKSLESLEKQTAHAEDFEVIVVDDGSTDDTPQVLQHYLSKTRLQLHLLRVEHGGPAKARNAAAKAASTDWLAFLDADMMASPTWIDRGLGLIAQHPEAGGFEGRTEIGDKEHVTPFTHQTANVHGGRYPTCNLIVRTALCHFNSDYPIPFREDSDLAFTILEAGYEIRFDEHLLAFHPPLKPNYQRPLISACRYYYDAILRKRFPQRYRNDIDVHFLFGMRLPHLRRRIYLGFVLSQLMLCAGMVSFPQPHWITMFLGSMHLMTYAVVVLVHLKHVPLAHLHFKDLIYLSLIVYWVPWVLLVQYARGLMAFRHIVQYVPPEDLMYHPGQPLPEHKNKVISLLSVKKEKNRKNSSVSFG